MNVNLCIHIYIYMYVCVRRRFSCQSSQSAELMYQYVTCICICNYTRTCIQNFNHAKLQKSPQIKKKNQEDIICIYIYRKICSFSRYPSSVEMLSHIITTQKHTQTPWAQRGRLRYGYIPFQNPNSPQ